MVAIRQLRQPEIIDYPAPPTVDELDAAINAAFDALLASCGDTLTDAQWGDVFALWDCRRLLASNDPDDLRLIADVVRAVGI